MVEVINRQRKRPIDLKRWETFTERALKASPAGQRGVTVAFISDRAMAKLNQRWRAKRGTTDVLSFPAGPEDFESAEELQLGDVVISIDRAAKQASENGITLENEISQLILHGLLHLCGYDHETDKGEMNRLELRLRKKLGI